MPSSKALSAIFTVLLLSNSARALPNPLESLVSGFGSLLPTRFDSWTKRQQDNSSTPSTQPTSVWILQDIYQGKTFFDDWSFYTGPDPTRGLVRYVDRDEAFANGLAAVTDKNEVIMKGDNTTWLPMGVNRSSVRITSNKWYTGGLFLLDLTAAPWGCGVWPAFWTFGQSAQWPAGGEIDIIEGVHDNIHNQVAWHTEPGCMYTPSGNYTGTPKQLDCNGLINDNAGCGVTDWSRVSYGETFTAQGGGVYAMKWDEESIAVWYFYRASLPPDIVAGTPNPKSWTIPSAELSPAGCDLEKYFYNHSIIFDITFCGDWAGNTYNSNPQCPGTCPERLMDPTNFMNASWNINNLKVYRKAVVNGTVSSDSPQSFSLSQTMMSLTTLAALFASIFT